MKEAVFLDDLPSLDPIIGHEDTPTGWRGLTSTGEVFEIAGTNGHKAKVPAGDLLVMRAGQPIGRRAIMHDAKIGVGDYVRRCEYACDLLRANNAAEALAEIEHVIAQAPTARAQMNRAMMLLALGRWPEGFAAFEFCERAPPFERPLSAQAKTMGIPQWYGESISGKRLLLIHDHGFGDTIQMLRYLPRLRDMGADVVMLLPPELQAMQIGIGEVVQHIVGADYFCPFLMLGFVLRITPQTVGANVRLAADRRDWGLGPGRKVGVAWSVKSPATFDYPREIALAQLVEAFPFGTQFYSVQKQHGPEAEKFGVRTIEFVDFAECAALMTQMDEIVSVDTAALHLAGAIEHPCVTGLLSHWHSWRWQADWYPTVRLITQSAPGDWTSALLQF